MAVEHEAILDILRELSQEIRDLDVGNSVPRVTVLSSLQFLREFVAPNKPVVLTSAIPHWPALSSWSESYLRDVAGSTPITVALTPNGRADCPTPLPANCNGGGGESCFALPAQSQMPLATFLDLLKASKQDNASLILYYQHQNSCLTTELPLLVEDVEPDLPFATEAFGAAPDAVNLWIGAQGSVTSWHRDHYENLYAIITGRKTFRLFPPTESYRMRMRQYPLARYTRPATPPPPTINSSDKSTNESINNISNGTVASQDSEAQEVPTSLELVLEYPEQRVLWSSITPDDKNDPATLFSDPSLPPPLEVTLRPGEILYLPAGWWHEVHQGKEEEGIEYEPSIAVNYWYDMHFDSRYAAGKAVEALAECIGLNEGPHRLDI